MIDDLKLYQKILELQIIKDDLLKDAFSQSSEKKMPFAEFLLDRDIVSDENLGKIIADIYEVPFIKLSSVPIDDSVLQIIPEIVAKKQKIIAFKKDQNGFHLAMFEPSNLEIQDFIKKKTGEHLVPYFATNRDIVNTFSLYSKKVSQAFNEILTRNIEEAKIKKNADPSIIKIVDTIITYAYQNKASDVHLEPHKNESLARFRIDGVLHDIVELPYILHAQIVTRIKVLSELRTDEHFTAQDGKMQFTIDPSTDSSENLDIRVSIVPVTEGEKIVLRLLASKSREFSLVDLGILQRDLNKLKRAYEKPWGMILATGPTGCGKTTTMYAVLKILNQRNVNIMTIEDPVEYEIAGVNQIQVNPKTGLTFAKGLRSIVRQDPDIILVGEIRDHETAEIAVNSAMTGHLVLSTLHTNNAATSLPRLYDMQIEPFLIASSINLVIAQRLVRSICLKCRVSYEISQKEIKQFVSANLLKNLFGTKETLRLYKGKGCPVCHQSGYKGRIGIFEVLEIDDGIREAIVDHKDASIIQNLAIKSSMRTMVEDGLEKVKEGITTMDEVFRVTKE